MFCHKAHVRQTDGHNYDSQNCDSIAVRVVKTARDPWSQFLHAKEEAVITKEAKKQKQKKKKPLCPKIHKTIVLISNSLHGCEIKQDCTIATDVQLL